jgi:hypothetical protein
MFELGQKVYRASYNRVGRPITCPECGGSLKITVELFDGTRYAIDCKGCDPGGYQGPRGVIMQYEFAVETSIHTVTGVKMSLNGTEYELDNFGQGCGYYRGNDLDVFGTLEDARAHGEGLRNEKEQEKNAEMLRKTNDHKTWAWNLTYHSSAAKRLLEEAEYHQQKAQLIAPKAKTTKAKVSESSDVEA